MPTEAQTSIKTLKGKEAEALCPTREISHSCEEEECLTRRASEILQQYVNPPDFVANGGINWDLKPTGWII